LPHFHFCVLLSMQTNKQKQSRHDYHGKLLSQVFSHSYSFPSSSLHMLHLNTYMSLGVLFVMKMLEEEHYIVIRFTVFEFIIYCVSMLSLVPF